jgi:hypothetical protein
MRELVLLGDFSQFLFPFGFVCERVGVRCNVWLFVKTALRISVENRSIFGILAEMSPRFLEMNKVRVNDRENAPYEGYVIGSQFRDGRWIYKLSISEDPKKSETYDNWAPEEWLELTK